MMNINATQLVGLLGFGLAAVFCYGAWKATRHDTHLWGWITLMYILMTADTVLGGRYLISSAIRAVLKSGEIYRDRRIWQVGIVICLLVLAGVFLCLALRAGSRRQKRVISAVLVSLLAPVFFMLEAISLHSIDAILYHAAGPVLVIGWVWIALAVLTVVHANNVRLSRP